MHHIIKQKSQYHKANRRDFIHAGFSLSAPQKLDKKLYDRYNVIKKKTEESKIFLILL